MIRVTLQKTGQIDGIRVKFFKDLPEFIMGTGMTAYLPVRQPQKVEMIFGNVQDRSGLMGLLSPDRTHLFGRHFPDALFAVGQKNDPDFMAELFVEEQGAAATQRFVIGVRSDDQDARARWFGDVGQIKKPGPDRLGGGKKLPELFFL